MCIVTEPSATSASPSASSAAQQARQQPESAPLTADYLVIGTGTAGMSFVDTLLTEDADATVIMVDRNNAPGGHWTTAYPHVRLHQPASYYGVNSRKLGKLRDKKGREKFHIDDRATGAEVAEYYAQVAEQFRQSGRVQLMFDSEYEETGDGKMHTVTNRTTGEVTTVSCNKVVKVHTNLLVPSMRDGPPFPVDGAATVVPVNDLPPLVQSGQYSKYIIIGAGKTGLDSVTHLLRNGVDQSAITWIISRDVWYFIRDGYIREGNSYWKDVGRLLSPLEKASSIEEAFLLYEKDEVVARLDPTRPLPEVFKGATIDKGELAGLRTVKNVVRKGRVTEIASDSIALDEGSIEYSPADTLIVDCMADFDMTFYGYNFDDDFQIFEPGRINLGPLITVFNPSFSSAIIAYIEAKFEDDSNMRNSMMYFLRGEHTKPVPSSFFGMFYAQGKTIQALGKYSPAMNFVLNSRTNNDTPIHHGGMLPFLWGMFGPLQIAKRGDAFIQKVESGGFSDVKDCFGNGWPIPEAGALRIKKKKPGKKKSRHAMPYPPKNVERKKAVFNCCSSMAVIQ
jgi:hypothetical protein